MATHDYVIANASGAAVRADLNNALAAIVSLNSNATEPATTYAYMLWADTTAGILKMRDGTDTAWLDLIQLDGIFGTVSLADGAAATPSLTFGADTDVGLYRDANNTLGISTAGVSRVTVSNTAAIISPELQVNGGSQFNAAGLNFNLNTDTTLRTVTAFNYGCTDPLDQSTGTQASVLRLDNDGRLELERKGGTATTLIEFAGKTTVDGNYNIARFKGDADALDIRNFSASDYSLVNPGQSNQIRFADSTGGIKIFYNADSTKNFELSSFGVCSQYIYDSTSGGATNYLRIASGANNYTIQRSTSSRRYKDNIENYTGGLSRISAITPRAWNDHKSGERCVGFVAEELHEAGYTDAVAYDPWQGGSEVGIGDDPSPMTGNGTAPVTKTGEPLADEVEVVENVSDRTIICDLVLAVQELTARISALESA